ncbi:hypothetical protein ACVIDN_004303 [Rhizobium brockwellii]
MRQRRTCAARRLSNRTSAEFLHGVESVAAGLVQNADAVDDVARPVDGAVDRAAIAQVRLDEGNLADIAERLQEASEIGTSHGDADVITALGQRPNHVSAHEARPSEHGDERRQVGKGHGRLLERLCGMLNWLSS